MLKTEQNIFKLFVKNCSWIGYNSTVLTLIYIPRVTP